MNSRERNGFPALSGTLEKWHQIDTFRTTLSRLCVAAFCSGTAVSVQAYLGAIDGRKPTRKSIDCPHEEDRLSLVRALDALVAIADPLGRGHAAAIHRAGRRRRGAGRGRRLFPGPSFRPPARLALPAAGGRRREDQPHRDRHGGDRHALREPALHGRGRRVPPISSPAGGCSSASAEARPSR